MKSKVFTTAWKLFRTNKFNWSFSSCLRTAWDCVKNNVEVIVNKSFNGNVTLGFKKQINKSTSITKSSIYELNRCLDSFKSINLEGAKHYYGTGHYNTD